MSYTSGFFDAVDLGGGEYDREYSAAVFAHYFSLLVKNGVFPDPSTGMQIKASTSPDMHVTVQPGSGWVNGYYITVPENGPEVLTVPTANPSLSRIDSVIMGLNYVEREIQLYIKPGAVSASPIPVSLQRDNDLYELELAQITVAAGVASISQANITDMRQNTSRCGIVKGTIDQIDTTDLFAQYDDAFQTWFDDIQVQLSGDVATNLQNQINTLKTDKVNVLDKASTAQAQAGTDNTKWMTPALVKAWWDNLYSTLILPVAKGGTGKTSFEANKVLYGVFSQLGFPGTAGSFLRQGTSGSPYWTKPTDVPSDIGVMGYVIKNCPDASIYGTNVTLTASAVSSKLSNPSKLASNGDYSLITLNMSALASNETLVYLGTIKLFSGTASTGSYGTTNYWDLSLIVNGVTYFLSREVDGFTTTRVKLNIPALIGRGLVNTDTVQLKATANGTHSTSSSSGGYVDYVTGVPAVGATISSDSTKTSGK